MSNPTSSQHIDLLDEDKPISGQKFACVSFVSPENIIREKHQYFFSEFTKQWGLTKSLEKFTEFLSFLSYKYELSHESLQIDLENFCKEEQDMLRKNGVSDDFQNFLDKEEDKLTEQFQRDHGFQTSVRGLKNRGNFATQEEAESTWIRNCLSYGLKWSEVFPNIVDPLLKDCVKWITEDEIM